MHCSLAAQALVVARAVAPPGAVTSAGVRHRLLSVGYVVSVVVLYSVAGVFAAVTPSKHPIAMALYRSYVGNPHGNGFGPLLANANKDVSNKTNVFA